MTQQTTDNIATVREQRQPVLPYTTQLTADDIYLFNEGTHNQLYDKLGAHLLTVDGRDGTYFATWAPNAEQVFVIGDFNKWDKASHPLQRHEQSGIWEGFIPRVG